VKVHPRAKPGARVTDAGDLPADKTAYALRDLDALARIAAGHGEAIGAYAAAVLQHPLPWTKMRQVYALLGLVKRWGPEKVNAACVRALDAEAISVSLIGRMLQRGTEHGESGENSATTAASTAATTPAGASAPTAVLTGRFARDPGEFSTGSRREGPRASEGGAA